MALRHGWIKGQNHFPPQHNDSINLRQLMPDRTRAQIKHEKHLRKFVPAGEKNGRTKKIEGVALVQKHISEGNAEEANRCLGKLIFEEQIKPALDIIASGIEMDLITFTAETEGW